MSTYRVESARIREIAVSRWWNGTDLSSPLSTVDGRCARVVYRGNWSHGIGPDFQKAMIDFGDGRLQTGSIEIHLTTSAWRQHGHQHDPRYNDVVLHVVLEHDGSETRRADGRLIPVAIITPETALLETLQDRHIDWHLVGGDVCAAHIARDDPAAIRAELWQLGDRRLDEKVAQLSARLDRDLPADLLFELIMDGLGYSSNREPMRQLAARMPIAIVDALMATVEPEDRFALAAGLLFGAAGFLPMTPVDAEIAHLSPENIRSIEHFWQSHGGSWHRDRLPPHIWHRIRVRPANHPVARLTMAAALLTTTFEGFTATIVDAMRRGDDPLGVLMTRSSHGDAPGLGHGRAVAIVANAIIPFLLALAEVADDPELSECTSQYWERLETGESNQITRRAIKQVAGDIRIGPIGERGMQGLIHLDRHYCEPRRCLECPIAWLALVQHPMKETTTLE